MHVHVHATANSIPLSAAARKESFPYFTSYSLVSQKGLAVFDDIFRDPLNHLKSLILRSKLNLSSPKRMEKMEKDTFNYTDCSG